MSQAKVFVQPSVARSNSSSSVSSIDLEKKNKAKAEHASHFRPPTLEIENGSENSSEESSDSNSDESLVLKDFNNSRPQKTMQVSLSAVHEFFQHDDISAEKDYDSAGEHMRGSYIEEQIEYKETAQEDNSLGDDLYCEDSPYRKNQEGFIFPPENEKKKLNLSLRLIEAGHGSDIDKEPTLPSLRIPGFSTGRNSDICNSEEKTQRRELESHRKDENSTEKRIGSESEDMKSSDIDEHTNFKRKSNNGLNFDLELSGKNPKEEILIDKDKRSPKLSDRSGRNTRENPSSKRIMDKQSSYTNSLAESVKALSKNKPKPANKKDTRGNSACAKCIIV